MFLWGFDHHSNPTLPIPKSCDNSLTRRIPTLPRGTAEVHFCFTSPFSPLSSDPSCQLLNTNCWFSVCPFLHTDFEKNDVLKKTDCSRRMRKVVFNPPKIQPYPFFSKIILLIFFGEKLFCNFHHLNLWWERLLSWERSLIEMCERTMQCHFTGLNMSSNMAQENDEWLNMHFPSENV